MAISFEYGEDIKLVLAYTRSGNLITGESISYILYDSNGAQAYTGSFTEHVSNEGIYLATITPSPAISAPTRYLATYIRNGKIIGGADIIVAPFGLTEDDRDQILNEIEEADKYSDGVTH